MSQKSLRLTIKEAAHGEYYVSLEEQCGKIWGVTTFFGGKLDIEKLKVLTNFSLAFDVNIVYL